MPISLSVDEVTTETGATVTATHIAVAKARIYDETGYTVDEHIDDRAKELAVVKAAWAVVATRVAERMQSSGDSIVSESQGDYSYSEDATLARHARFGNVVDGLPLELLEIRRARWAHI